MIFDKSYVPEQFEQQSNLYVKSVEGKGRGVFSKAAITKDQVIEICPVITMEKIAAKCNIKHYFWHWPDEEDTKMCFAIALGFGPLYNHSFEPNARFYRKVRSKIITFVALKDIPANTEILCNYNGRPDDKSSVDFDVVG